MQVSQGKIFKTRERIIYSLYHGLIVSCHAEQEEPFDKPEVVAIFARAAELGGARALRIEGEKNIVAIRNHTRLPIIGFTKGAYIDGSFLITPDYKDVEQIIAAKADVIAIDCTSRKRPNGLDGLEFFQEVRKKFRDAILWADVSVFREGVKAAEYGADLVSTTLSGYTANTTMKDHRKPDYTLIRELSLSLTIPVIAEGRIWTPFDASLALEEGAYAVVVGTAITRPRVVTQMFVSALDEISQSLTSTN